MDSRLANDINALSNARNSSCNAPTRIMTWMSGGDRARMTNISLEAIVRKLGRYRSTIFCELKRNQFNDDEITDLKWSLI